MDVQGKDATHIIKQFNSSTPQLGKLLSHYSFQCVCQHNKSMYNDLEGYAADHYIIEIVSDHLHMAQKVILLYQSHGSRVMQIKD